MSPRPDDKKKSTRPLPRKKKPSRAVVAQPPLTGKQKMHLRGLGHRERGGQRQGQHDSLFHSAPHLSYLSLDQIWRLSRYSSEVSTSR